MAASDWIEDSDEELDQWAKNAKEAEKRASRPMGITDKFERKNLGDVSEPSVFRPISAKFGEHFRHWLWINGKKIPINCAITPDQFDNRVEVCPACARTAAGGCMGPGGEYSDYNHGYYFIGLMGKIKKVYTQNPKNPNDPEDVLCRDQIIWPHKPTTFEATDGLFPKMVEFVGDKTFPEGAEGDLRKYNMKIWKYLRKGATGKNSDIRYDCEHSSKASERPAVGFDEEGQKVPIDLSIAMSFRDQIQAECTPASPEVIRALLAQESSRTGVATPPEEAVPTTPTDAAASTAPADDFDDSQPVATPAPQPAPSASTVGDNDAF